MNDFTDSNPGCAVPPGLPDRRQSMSSYVRLQLALRAIQARLGTKDERSSDLGDARELAHQIANHQIALALWSDLMSSDSDTGAAGCGV